MSTEVGYLKAKGYSAETATGSWGLLNHISKAVVPGRPFVRKFYHKTKGLRQYHRLKVDDDLKLDCKTWIEFLKLDNSVCRPFEEFKKDTFTAEVLNLYSDASKAHSLGFGGRLSTENLYFDGETFKTFIFLRKTFIFRKSCFSVFLLYRALPIKIYTWEKFWDISVSMVFSDGRVYGAIRLGMLLDSKKGDRASANSCPQCV